MAKLKELLDVAQKYMFDWYDIVLSNPDNIELRIHQCDYNNNLLEVTLWSPEKHYDRCYITMYVDDTDLSEIIATEYELDLKQSDWVADYQTFMDLDCMLDTINRIRKVWEEYEE